MPHGTVCTLRCACSESGRAIKVAKVLTAIVLIGGDKTGDDRFYKEMIPVADHLYDDHLPALGTEGLIK
jgi:hypothetical protein